MKKGFLGLVVLLLVFPALLFSQNETDERALLEVDDGVGFSKDSTFLLNMRFRMQNRFGFSTEQANSLDIRSFDARVRRLRLRFDGFVFTTKLQYYIQLSFSRADQDLEVGDVPQIIRDAIIYYTFNDNFYVGFGQAKLPGNRQRVISSGNLQFADRSTANSLFTLDRDFGFFGYYDVTLGGQVISLKASLTSGDGRNALATNDGLNYAARAEWLPFGAFANSGHYSEGDLEMEPTPKLSVGASYSYNHKAVRTGGQLGEELFSPVSFGVFIADAMLKYKGWAVLAEYFRREAEAPVTFSPAGDVRFVYVGSAANIQLSKYFTSTWEYACRYSYIAPNTQISELANHRQDLLFGVNKYFNGHRIKWQANIGYTALNHSFDINNGGNFWSLMTQVEFGI